MWGFAVLFLECGELTPDLCGCGDLKTYGCDVHVFHIAIFGEVKLFTVFRQILM